MSAPTIRPDLATFLAWAHVFAQNTSAANYVELTNAAQKWQAFQRGEPAPKPANGPTILWRTLPSGTLVASIHGNDLAWVHQNARGIWSCKLSGSDTGPTPDFCDRSLLIVQQWAANQLIKHLA